MARIKTFTNGGSLLPGDLNSIQDDYEAAFSSYKIYRRVDGVSGGASSTFAAGTYMFVGSSGGVVLSAGAASALASSAFYLDPADVAAAPRTAKLRLGAGVIVNGTAPATTMTFGLYPVATFGGASPNMPTVATLGTVVAGSTVGFASPAASSSGQVNSGDFTYPSAGYYVIGIVNSGTSTANSVMAFSATLQYRQV